MKVKKDSGRVYGVDFSSAPSRRKPITIAIGHCQGEHYRLDQVVAAPDFEAFESFLNHEAHGLLGLICLLVFRGH